jgi:hypothetical protein
MAKQEHGHGILNDSLKVYIEGRPLSFDEEIYGRAEEHDDGVTLYLRNKTMVASLREIVNVGGFFTPPSPTTSSSPKRWRM